MSTSDDEFTDELEQDEEIEAVADADDIDDVAEDVEVEAAADDSGEEEATPAVAAAAKVDPTLDEEAKVRTVTSRDHLRQKLEDEIKRFLSSGGHIQQLAAADDGEKY